MTTEAKRTAASTHNAPEFRHPSEMDWEMGRFNNVTKFLFHPTPERPTVPNAGFLRYEPGAGFPLHKHDFAQVWYIIDGEFQMGERKYGPGTLVYMEDPHFENEMRTETGGTVLFVQYPGPTTGGLPIYEGRMNLKAAPPPEQIDLEH
jgi:mannose-6-phosphate isomerase-like protein (cupin superfamily)